MEHVLLVPRVRRSVRAFVFVHARSPTTHIDSGLYHIHCVVVPHVHCENKVRLLSILSYVLGESRLESLRVRVRGCCELNNDTLSCLG